MGETRIIYEPLAGAGAKHHRNVTIEQLGRVGFVLWVDLGRNKNIANGRLHDQTKIKKDTLLISDS